MSTHPNAILAVRLTPDELAQKTFRAIVAEVKTDPNDPTFKLGENRFNLILMQDTYDPDWQISAHEGDIVAHDFLTYGYGEGCTWAEVEKRKADLEEWAKGICERHKCSYEIFIAANYW
jgi:hypothetical protein